MTSTAKLRRENTDGVCPQRTSSGESQLKIVVQVIHDGDRDVRRSIDEMVTSSYRFCCNSRILAVACVNRSPIFPRSVISKKAVTESISPALIARPSRAPPRLLMKKVS